MVMLRRHQFTAVVWALSVIGLPLLVYLGSHLANLASLPHAGCLPYDGRSGFTLGLFYGVTFATVVTVLSACDCVREGKGFNLWAGVVSVLYLGLAVFILYQTNACA